MKSRKKIILIKNKVMTDKEKLDAIRAEIHRLVDVRGYDRGMANDLFAFMDSLPNEPVSNDLEKEIELVKGDYEQVDVAWNNDFDFIARHFYELGLKTQKGE